ncbi:hypothetical protein GCM10009808_26010 [Microbacterium sediminicola]|uniref:SRPBCC family protein n=1 Tax=Microbacterium sediminicola TaxID=415210 RepID=A0ABP4UJM4_9MICO
MRVLSKFAIDCDADAAWRALHSPRVLAEVYGPLLDMQPLEAMPTRWEHGDNAAVGLSVGGLIPVGRQLISITDSEREVDGVRVRIIRDSGIPLTGPLAALDVWDHQMAVSALPDGRALWRERLVIGGAAAPALWPGLWATWQWRSARVRAIAPSWAHDPGSGPDPAPPAPQAS